MLTLADTCIVSLMSLIPESPDPCGVNPASVMSPNNLLAPPPGGADSAECVCYRAVGALGSGKGCSAGRGRGSLQRERGMTVAAANRSDGTTVGVEGLQMAE